MKTLDPLYIAKKNALIASSAGAWVWLLELYRDSTTVLRYAKTRRTSVTYNGNTYTARAFHVDPPPQDSNGSTINFTVTVQNVDKLMSTYVEAGELKNERVKLIFVNLDLVATTANEDSFESTIINIDYDNHWASFTCGSHDLRAIKGARRTYTRDRCWYEYKRDHCGYAGAGTACDKRQETCAAYSNQDRFSGAVGMPINRP